jgi:peroxiredoxin
MTKRLAALLVFAFACHQESPPAPPAVVPSASAPSVSAATVTGTAELGKPAPAFSLPDLDGKNVSLADFKGKIVVLEWFNAGCPFVKRNHEQGPLKDMAKRVTKNGIVWLSINSSAPGKEGSGVEANRGGKTRWAMDNPILIDETGTVGHAYGAQRTPHMYVIDVGGNLVYRGAIDNAQDGDTEQGAPFVNYVEAALGDLAAGRPVKTAETKSYGCSVKY